MKTAADKTAFPIDAVITWVDGADPEHRQKRDHYRKLAGIPTAAVPTTQYNQIGELAFVLRSIIQFAPFVRHIYIV
ncbi:MAG: Stealth CR1 domain-containing protein, partial [Flavobacteriaceae bacterium]